MSHYQNSECKRNMLHDYKILAQTNLGLLERCTRCGDKKHFTNDIPNHIYLSFHLRQALQRNDPRFNIEYGKR